MTCYACRGDAVAECPRCARAYCAHHGATTCNVCAAPASVFPSAALYRSTIVTSAALMALAAAYLLWWPDTAPAPARLALAAQPSGIRPDLEVSPPRAPGVASTAAPSPTATPTPPPVQRKYTVVSGDTLLAIALRYDTTVEELMRLNGLTNPGRLSIGQELVLDPAPPAGSAAGGSSPLSPAPPSAAAAPVPRKYSVVAGDTLLGIALDHNTTVEELMRLNGLSDPGRLSVGQELVLP